MFNRSFQQHTLVLRFNIGATSVHKFNYDSILPHGRRDELAEKLMGA